MKNPFTVFSVLLTLVTVGNLAAQPLPGTILWTYEAGAQLVSPPSLAPDGAIYLMSNGLNAITNSGSTASNKWTFPINGNVPAVGSDGTIYFVGYSGLYAVTPDGTQKWTYPVAGADSVSAIGLDDTVYFVAEGRLYAIAPSGIKRWDDLLEFDSSHWFAVQSPVVGTDGTIYVGVADRLYAVNRDGTNKWFNPLNSFGENSPAIGANGVIYTFASRLYAIDSGGNTLWSIIIGGPAPPAVGLDGTLYVSGLYRSLNAVTPVGNIIWHVLQGPQYGGSTTPAIDAGGRIYYCVSNTVWAVNPEGQVQWSITTPNITDPRLDVARTSPIIGPDGTLYAALGSTLYAIATGTNGPANSPWPMYRQNARHTGKVEKPALKQPKKRADANFEFQLYAQLGQTNTVESTTDLSTWTSLASVLVTNVPMDFVDLTASNFPSRFYRTTSPP